MKKKLLLAGLVIVIGLGWLYHVGRKEQIRKLCEEINYRVDCNDAWSKYRLTGDPGDRPLCYTGEMSIRQRIEYTNAQIKYGCPVTKFAEEDIKWHKDRERAAEEAKATKNDPSGKSTGVRRGKGSGAGVGNVPRAGTGGDRGGRGGIQNMQLGAQMFTDTQGIDFSSYLQRLVATVKRNWYTVLESAIISDKGIVMLTFKINRDGSVPLPDPTLERTSGKQPLDSAALSSIRTSSPFEPLPPAFKGDFIELRFIYFYNLPPDVGRGKGGGAWVGDDPSAGTGGDGIPACLYCPDPQFSDDAVKAKYQGTVVLMAVITADGRATNIRISKGLGMGLDEKAIEAVRTWRFRPAVGPDGKAAAVTTPIEVVFRP